jgi:hypothetical protein
MFMSLRNRLVLPIIFSALALSALGILAGCSSGNGVTNPVVPPSGKFSNSNLNGTYVFSVSGTDVNGAPSAMVGTITANGSGGITGGTLDINNAEFTTPVANLAVGSGTYSIGVDGRARATLNATTPFPNKIILDFVLQDDSHGLITEFDGNATGSGTLDLQSSGTTPTGTYAFSLSGGSYASGSPFAAVGNFTVGSGGSLTGLEDVNEGGVDAFPGEPLNGSLTLGPSSNPATTLSSAAFNGLFDVFAIDANHLKFIEMDQTATLVGDAFSQTSATLPTGTLTFVLAGIYPSSSGAPFAAGGFMVTDGNGNITSASSEDYNEGGTVSTTLGAPFTATYTAGGTGRYTLSNFATFVGGTSYAAYPSSGGVLLLEIDNAGLTTGAAYSQTSGATFAASQGYGLNLTGTGTNPNTGNGVEVDDIAEFASNSTGTTAIGVIDENYDPGGLPNYGVALSGTYTAPVSGRGQIVANAGNSNNSTLNGGFGLIFYTVDGTTFPFIEADTSQVSAGVFVAQNPAASAAAIARPHMFVVQPLVRSRASQKK